MDKDYSQYAAEDFAADRFFEQWVNHPDTASNQFWEQWLARNPRQKPIIEEARGLVLLMSFKPTVLEPQRADAIFNRITHTINEGQTHMHSKPASKRRWLVPSANWTRLAAACTGILLVCSLLFYLLQRNATTTYATGYRETRTITLPDQSVVTLNANSSIEFTGDWQEDKNRVVYLQGEAFFSVVHTKNHQKFIVVTSDDANIEVLGTKFNVKNRRGNTRVVLSSGKVKLNLESNNEIRNVIMQPGQLIEVSATKKIIANRIVKTEAYTAWQNNILTFDDTPLWQIAQTLEDNYGIKVEIQEAALMNRRYTGSTPADKVDVLLAKLARIFDAKVTRDGNEVMIKSNEK